MPSVTLSPVFVQKFFDNAGNPLSGGKLFSYLATTTTKTSTYTSSTGGTPNANPVILDFRGEANVWIEPNTGYKFVLAPANDTDPPTNPIWTVDNVKNSQLITLYGGTDTGVANAYVLTFTASFTAYTDGILIYFTPANTNSGASTLNVNGLGIVNITNLDGSALGGNQIVANQLVAVMYVGGSFLLLSSTVSSGTFTPAWSGFSSDPTGDMAWQLVGDLVTLEWTGGTGTSNATHMTFGNLPFNLRPTSKSLTGMTACYVIDNNIVKMGSMGHGSLGTVQFNLGTAPPSGTGFTNPGTKGLSLGWSASYLRK